MRELKAFFVKLLRVHSNFKLNKEETQTCKLALLISRHVAIFPMVFYKKKQTLSAGIKCQTDECKC